jgi:hypothetical protein
MHLILSKACGNGARAVRLYTEKYPQCRVLNPHTFYTIDLHNMETGNVCSSMVYYSFHNGVKISSLIAVYSSLMKQAS